MKSSNCVTFNSHRTSHWFLIVPDALEDLQSFASRSDIKNQSSPADNTTNFPVCSEMLNEAEKLGPEAMQQVTEALFSGGYIEKGNFGLLDRIVRACLARYKVQNT